MRARGQVDSKLVCYSSEQIPEVWNEARPHIKRALDRGSRYTLDQVYQGLCDAKMQLWTWRDEVIHTCLVTTIQIKTRNDREMTENDKEKTRNDTKFCLLLAVGGSKMDEWVPYLYLVEKWAKGEGCTEMRVYGRRGWGKVLGYQVEYCKMVRKL